ncbi:MAG: MFS transporter [Pseudomonadota bacterium]
MSPAASMPTGPRPAAVLIVILAACAIAVIGFGLRSSLGLFLEPMTEARDWSRASFSLALAVQNLFWGLGLPFAGALADKIGPARVIAFGSLLYAAGLTGMAYAPSESLLVISAGVLAGTGIAFTAFTLALAAMARVVGPSRRSLALGLGTAAGSFGQVVFSPLGQAFISNYGWQSALLIFVGMALSIIPFAFMLPSGAQEAGKMAEAEQTMGDALREAFAHQGYILLTIGFFVCGFHVAFMTVHMPAYVIDLGLAPQVGAYCLALIGLFNIAGSLAAGAIGQRFAKQRSLAAIYFLRAVAIGMLLLAPKTATTLYIFSAVMGLLWLSTVPLTTGIVAQVFGVRYMATLFGIVFLSHQIGSFIGVYFGGYLYDVTGSYDGIWYAGIALGLLATLVHLPINERPLPRLNAANA